VEILLEAGFADGALSRWRTLHEVAMVALFLQQFEKAGSDVARRYLDHLAVDSLSMARKYRDASSKLGHSDITDREFAQLQAEVDALKHRYGKEFGSEYGWAASALNISSPTFAQIEDAVDFSKLRPYYKLASNAVHAGPKGAFWRLGLAGSESDVMLAGPSNAGLAEAGRLTAMSLSQISVALMLVHTTIDGIVWARILLHLWSEVEEEFLKVEGTLKDDERRSQRFRTTPGRRLSVGTKRSPNGEKPSERMRRRVDGSGP
jgi:hypothetical protein